MNTQEQIAILDTPTKRVAFLGALRVIIGRPCREPAIQRSKVDVPIISDFDLIFASDIERAEAFAIASGTSMAEPEHTKQDLCESAVRQTLGRIADDPATFYLLGDGTESYSRLTKALAAITGLPEEEIVEQYRPHEAKWDRYMQERDANEKLLRHWRENGITVPED